MKKALLPLAIAAALPMTAFAEVTVYGKANISYQNTDESGDTEREWVSNASRLGFKGSEDLGDGLKAIYKLEYEIYLDDGDSGSSKGNDTFEQRNIYVGLQGDWGTIIAGKFDTPLKKAQKKIDLFGDLEGDIKSIITKSDNRESNSFQYSSPKAWGPVRGSLAYVESENSDDDGFSVSLAYDTKNIYVAIAHDQDVEAEDVDVTRVVGQFKFGDFQLGALWEDQDADNGSGLRDEDGWVVSAKYKATKNLALKAQFGQSDIVTEDGDTWSLGLDYKLSKSTKLFGYYTDEDADDNSKDADYLGVGMEMKF